jgi:hypothetical protein
MPQEDIAGQWKSFDDAKRDRLLKKMTPEQKKILRGKLEAKSSTKPEKVAPPESTGAKVARGAAIGAFEGLGVKPAASAGEVITGTLKQAGEGIKGLVKSSYEQTPVGAPPEVRAAGTLVGLPATFIEKTADTLEAGGRQTIQDIENKDWEAAAEHGTAALTQAATLAAPRRVGPTKTVGELRSAVAPREVPIAGEEIPVLKGEADPGSVGGGFQKSLKQSGIGARRFTQFAEQQMSKVKEVIRKTAQQTSGAIGPMQDEPAAAIGDAANATFEKARPMYNALDQALVTVPDSLAEVSKVTQQAIERAKKLGVDISQAEPESVTVSGQKYTPANNPRAWALLKEQGLVPESGGQPISTYMKVRSELLKMQRSATDAAMRTHIGNEIKTMNANMEAALTNSPLLESWHEANRLWSKGYALREVADAVREKTSGTPTAMQSPDLSPVGTKVQGKSLVDTLNTLQHDGILDRAFSPEEVKNLRQSIDILDRASSGAGTEFKVGYGVHSTLWRNIIGLPLIGVVRAMTTMEGSNAIRSGNIQALRQLVVAGGVAGIQKPATPGELRERIRPNSTSAPSQ